MKIDFEKLEKETGILKNTNETDLILYIKNIIDYLATHNKNYNNPQYFKISLLKDIFKSIE